MERRDVLRPLYLDGRKPLTVDLDGPALRVDTPGRAPSRYPLRCLSRLVVCGDVELRTRALSACLGAGVAIGLLDARGDLAGLCLPARPRRTGVAMRIEEFATRPDWPPHYATWLHAAERRAVLHALRASGLAVRDLRAHAVRMQFRQALDLAAGIASAGTALGLLEASASLLAAQWCGELGLGPTLLADDARGGSLVHDLGGLLHWDARALALTLLRRAPAAVARRMLIESFEARRRVMESHFQEYLGLLDACAGAVAGSLAA